MAWFGVGWRAKWARVGDRLVGRAKLGQQSSLEGARAGQMGRLVGGNGQVDTTHLMRASVQPNEFIK